MTQFNSVKDIYEALGGAHEIARRLAKTQSTIYSHITRGKIPPEFHLPLVELAKERNLDGVTLEVIARLHSSEDVQVHPASPVSDGSDPAAQIEE